MRIRSRRWILSILATFVALGSGPSAVAAPKKRSGSSAPETNNGPVQIGHSVINRAEREKDLLVRAIITAQAGVYLPTLYYRFVGENRFYTLPMLAVPGALDIYAASIPGLFVTKNIEYYIESFDLKLQGPARSGSSNNPNTISVYEPPVPPTQVVVRSDPTGAQLAVDGEAAGVTPWMGMLKPGSHELVFRKEGAQEVMAAVDVPEGRDLETLRTLPRVSERSMFAVMSEPADAKVSIDGQVLGVSPVVAPSPDGTHRISVERSGYARAERVVSFSKDRSMETTFVLRKLPPEPALAVTTNPQGAKVVVDGRELGTTPFIGVVPAGEHRLSLSREGHRSATAQLVMPDDRDLDLRFSLERADVQRPPRLAVNTEPMGATITIDGKSAGASPYTGEIAAGRHTVRIAADGFVPYEKAIDVPADNDQDLTIVLVKTAPTTTVGALSVTSEPSGVAVEIDGKPVGSSPVSAKLAAGTHTATVRKDGMRPITERFTIEAGDSLQLKYVLEPVASVSAEPLVTVVTDPPGATVTFDGAGVGESPVRMPLAPGRHTLGVSKDGHRSRDEAFDVPKGAPIELRFSITLQPNRKGVTIASAPEAQKERDQKTVIDPNEIRKERTSAAEEERARIAKALEEDIKRRAQTDTQRSRVSASLGGLGIVAGLVSAGLSYRTMADAKTAADFTSAQPNVLDRHDARATAAGWLAISSGVLAAAGVAWSVVPMIFSDSNELAKALETTGGDEASRQALAEEEARALEKSRAESVARAVAAATRDGDSDGLLDTVDACPDKAGPAINGGCPDTDQDGDGVVDRLDNCPAEKGTAANRGCAERQLVALAEAPVTASREGTVIRAEKKSVDIEYEDRTIGTYDLSSNSTVRVGETIQQGQKLGSVSVIEISESIYFQKGEDTVESRSYGLLDNIASVMAAHPEIAKIVVEGHSDSRGDAAENLRLSENRARSVVSYLIGKGIGANRLEVRAFGGSRPIATNDTEEGRTKNRRVVFSVSK